MLHAQAVDVPLEQLLAPAVGHLRELQNRSARGELQSAREHASNALDKLPVDANDERLVARASERRLLDLPRDARDTRVVRAHCDGLRGRGAAQSEHLGWERVEDRLHLRVRLEARNELDAHALLEDTPAATFATCVDLVVRAVVPRDECKGAELRGLGGGGGAHCGFVVRKGHARAGVHTELAVCDRPKALLEHRTDALLVGTLRELSEAQNPMVVARTRRDLLELQNRRADCACIEVAHDAERAVKLRILLLSTWGLVECRLVDEERLEVWMRAERIPQNAEALSCRVCFPREQPTVREDADLPLPVPNERDGLVTAEQG